MDNAYDELKELGYDVEFVQGYERSAKKAAKNAAHIDAAAALAAKCDAAIVFIGLTDDYESEGFDRTHMTLPEAHNKLVEEIVRVNKNVIVVLAGGSPLSCRGTTA